MSNIPFGVTSFLCREFSVAIPVSDRFFPFPVTENAFISPLFLKGVIPGHGALEKCAPLFPRTLALNEKSSALKWFLSFYRHCFQDFSLSLILRSVIMPCLGVVVFGCLSWVHAAASICGLKSLAVCGYFSHYFPGPFFHLPSPSSPSGILGHKHEGFCFMLPVPKTFFISVYCSDWFLSIVLSSGSLVL